MNTSSLTAKGQVTIPSALRQQFLLQPGDKVLFEVVDGNLVIKPLKKNIDTLAGCLANDVGGRVATLEGMEQAIKVGYEKSYEHSENEEDQEKGHGHGRN